MTYRITPLHITRYLLTAFMVFFWIINSKFDTMLSQRFATRRMLLTTVRGVNKYFGILSSGTSVVNFEKQA